MPKLDLEHGLAPGAAPPDELVQAFFRRFLPDFYFVNAPLSRMRRHLELLRALPQRPVIADFHRPPGAGFTELTLCAHDDAQPGLLCKVVGTLAALKLDVHTAWIHTLSDPNDPLSGRRVVLDTLILSEKSLGRARPLSNKTQTHAAQLLAQVLNQALESDAAPRTAPRTAPLPVRELSAVRDGPWTRLTLRAADDAGLLFRVTRALAELELDVAHAQINTFETGADDIFFVRGLDGKALPDAQIAPLLERLRAMLENETSAV